MVQNQLIQQAKTRKGYIMSIKNVNGHGVTSILAGHGGTGAAKANLVLPQTKGPANYQGVGSKPGGGLPGGRSSKKKSVPSNATPTVKIS